MKSHLKPVFKKSADFKGSEENYNHAVWDVARQMKNFLGNDEPDGDSFRINTCPGVSNGDVGKALEYLRQAP
jgi:hypothetical protein